MISPIVRRYGRRPPWQRTIRFEFYSDRHRCWCIPPEHNAAFVAAMEDALEVYSRPYDEAYPVVCMDENRYSSLLTFGKDFVPKRMAFNTKITSSNFLHYQPSKTESP